jgi:hypothetical protein
MTALRPAVSQPNLKGTWNGYITTDNFDHQAGYIIKIEEQKDGVITGKGLLYRPNLYSQAYGLQQFIGTFSKDHLTISDIQILDEKLPTNDYVLCFKLSKLSYSKDKKELLTGSWDSRTTNCLPGKIELSRYDENDPNHKVPPYVLTALNKGPQTSFNNTSISNPLILDIGKPLLELELKDYLKNDNDTISVYLNRKLVLDRINITKRPLKAVVRLNRSLALNEIILTANNLGHIPPNTSMLTISDGEKKHKLLIESTLQKSVALYLKLSPN